MPSRRQFLLGASGAVAGAVVLPCLGGTAFAQEPVPPPADPSAAAAARSASTAGYAAERAERQSPINIVTAAVVVPPNAPTLVVDYPTNVDLDVEYISRDAAPAGCGIARADETVEALAFSRDAFVRFDGERYRLLQFHFHTRSEHRIDGTAFPLEQHFVHERVSDGRLLVVGVFLGRGGSGPQDRVLNRAPVECAAPVRLGGVNLRAMLPTDLTTYRYPGSLTTPEYAEGVRWHVMRRRVQISDAAVDRFQRFFPAGNARAVQPLNGRTVRQGPGRLA